VTFANHQWQSPQPQHSGCHRVPGIIATSDFTVALASST
jgi:hypothetical protein